MARILSIALERPRHDYSQEEVAEAVSRWLPEDLPGREKFLRAFSRSGVRRRAAAAPRERVFSRSGFEERNRYFGECFVEHGARAVAAAIEAGGWDRSEFHTFVTVSCTGFMIPSAEAHIGALLGLPPGVRRLPITELGCAAGAAGLGIAADLVEAESRRCAGAAGEERPEPGRPDKAILLAAEYPSLNLQLDDPSPDQAVSAALFGDGLAAVVIGEDGCAPAPPLRSGPRLLGRRSHLFPGTARAMGFDLRSSGFHIVLSREIPDLIGSALAPLVDEFLGELGWKRQDVRRWIIHPGGEKILLAARELLDLPEGALRHSREVLAEWGNTSSAAVLLVLERVLSEAGRGDRGLLIAFGPGFSMEMVALEW